MADELDSIRIRLEFEAEQAEKAANRMERQLLALEGRYDPLARATKKLDRDQKLLNAALDAGKIDAQRYAAMLDNVQREHADTEVRIRSMTAAVATEANAVSRLNAVLGSNQTRMFGMQMSQMVQQTMAGGDALRSIAMQLPDIGLAFGTAGIAIGAVGGLLIPMIGNMFGAGDAAEDAGAGVDRFSDALSDYQHLAAVAGASTNDLRTRFGAFADDVRAQARYMAEIKASTAVNDLAGSDFMGGIEDINRTIAALDAQAEVIDRIKLAYDQGTEGAERYFNAQESLGLFEDAARDAASAVGLTVEQARLLAPALDAIGKPGSSFEDVASNATLALEQIKGMYQGVTVLPPPIISIQENLQRVVAAAAEAATTSEAIGDGFAASSSAAADLLSSLDAQAEMQATILAYGRDSAEVAALRADRERESFEATLASMDASEAMKNELRLAFTVAQDLSAQADATAGRLGSASGAASGLSGGIAQASAFAAQLVARLGQVPAGIAAIAGQVDGAISALKQQNASLTYQIEQGITATAAGIKAQRDQIVEFGLAQGLSIDQVAELTAGLSAQADEAEGLAREQEMLNKTLSDQAAAAAGAAAATAGGGGGGGGLAGATREAAAAAREQEQAVEAARRILEDYDRQVEETARANAALAASWAQTFTDAAVSGDLSGAFAQLGRDSRSAFFDALGSGQGIGSILSGGISGVSSGLTAAMGAGSFGGAMSGIGAALSSAMPVIGGISTALSLLGSFSSSDIIGQGVSGRIGGGSYADEYSTTKRTSFWGLFSSTDKDSARNTELSRMLGQAATATRDQIRDLASGIGGSAERLGRISRQFDIDTQGMDAEGVQQALTQEVVAYQEKVAQAALGTSRFSLIGETATQTLERLTGNLSAYNDVQRVLGLDTLPKSIENAARAAKIMERAGGAQAVGAGASAYASGILDDQEQEQLLRKQMRRGLRRAGFNDLTIASEEEFQRKYERLVERNRLGKAAELLAMAPLFTELERMRDAREAEAEAAREAAAALRAQIADERMGIQREIWNLQGDEAAIRADVLSGLDASNRALKRQFYALLDQEEAAKAAAEAQERQTSAIERTMDLFRNPLDLNSDRFNDRYAATISASQDRQAQIQKEAAASQLAVLDLIYRAVRDLAKETRDGNLYGVNA